MHEFEFQLLLRMLCVVCKCSLQCQYLLPELVQLHHHRVLGQILRLIVARSVFQAIAEKGVKQLLQALLCIFHSIQFKYRNEQESKRVSLRREEGSHRGPSQ